MLYDVKAEAERKRCIFELPWLEERFDCYTNSIFDHLYVFFIENGICNNHIFQESDLVIVC